MPLVNLTNNLTTAVVPVAVANPPLAGNPTGPVTTANAVQLDLGIGRIDVVWVLDLLSLKVSSGNESYQFALLASNDPTFAAGNAELLAFHDFGAGATGRVGSPYTGASPIVPQANESIRRHIIPVRNVMGGFLLRYLQLLLTVGGTAPAVTLNSWIADRETLTG